MMTIPFRPAPPPPSASANTNNLQNLQPTSSSPTFRNQFNLAAPPPLTSLSLNPNDDGKRKKLPPPRPPPPKTIGNYNKISELKKPEHQSINILANLFGGGGGQSSNRTKIPINKSINRKIESPPDEITNNTSIELISFDSPPSSPQFSAKFNDNQRTSSANSFESNSLQSNSSGFSSGALSTLTNNGFEDDYFSLGGGTSSGYSSSMAWQNIDPFSPPPPPPPMQTTHYDQLSSKQFQTGDSTFYAATNELKMPMKKNTFPVEFDDSLSNGKSLLNPEPALTMPTIIRPVVGGKLLTKPKINYEPLKSLSKPQPPQESQADISNYNYKSEKEESYGIALYDFDAAQDGDLSLKVNDKIYLIKKIDNEWYYGKNKRGCEGIFPVNFINIVIPLNETMISNHKMSIANSSSPSNQSYTARTMFDFIGEVEGDLTIRKNDIITVLHEINSEWLYGSNGIDEGQFPKNFVEFIGH